MKGLGAPALRSGSATAALVALVGCGIAALAWFGYRAANEWSRSSSQLVERRTAEVGNLLVTAIERDMRAVQATVLDGREWDAASLGSPSDIIDVVAGAFARYPYPDSFFAWRATPQAAVFFARSDRVPAWLRSTSAGDRYPVEVLADEEAAQILAARIASDVELSRQYSTFPFTFHGSAYQAVARLVYLDATRDHVAGVFGFLVNMDWVRRNYFQTIIDQVTRIARAGEVVDCDIIDESGQSVLGRTPLQAGDPTITRQFPLTFFDPMLVATDPPADLQLRRWSIRISGSSDPTLAIAARGARRTLVVIAAGALLAGLGLLFTVRAARAAADVASMRSDFVSTVTHALKTPVSVIRGIGETMSRGRVATPERVREYAQLLVQEGHRLSRLVDNLLAYAQVTDAEGLYAFQAQRPAELVDEAVRNVRRVIAEAGFDLELDVPADLPLINADRTALLLALDNLLDNAIRYSGESRGLAIRVRAAADAVEFEIVDHGKGINADELRSVRRRFVREGHSEGHGSGLGLAIVNRIARDHGGQLTIHSAVGTGTTAALAIPVARA